MTRLRLATFNLENLDDRPGLDPPLSARIEVLRPQLLRLDADVLCLQEVHGQKPKGSSRRQLLALDRLLEGTAYADFHRASTLSRGHHPGEPWVADVHNLVVMSRWPIAEHCELLGQLLAPPLHARIGADGAPVPLGWERPLLYARLQLPGDRTLHVINLHLRAPLAASLPGGSAKEGPFSWIAVPAWAEGFYVSAIKRAGQALETRLLVDQLFDAEPEALIAVMGDLNAEERETAVRLLAAETTDTGNGRLAARSLAPVARSLPADRRFTTVHAGRRLMVDHILVSRPLLAGLRDVAIQNEILPDEAQASAVFTHPTESTHAPVVAELEL
jgi:endonuclease/exonuclease/phosphatase family metal-dependent hydrolase